MYKGVTTAELDTLAAETAAAMTTNHPDYATVSRKKMSTKRHQRSDLGRADWQPRGS